MSEPLTMEDIRASFGITEPESADDDQNPPSDETDPESAAEETDETDGEQAEETSEEESEEGDQGQPNKAPAQKDPLEKLQSKDTAAFAQMRIQNTKQQETLRNVAAVLGLDLKALSNPDELVDAVRSIALAAQAKDRGMAPEDLEELNALRIERRNYVDKARYVTAQENLISIQDEFHIPDENIKSFVDELVNDGLNPLEQDVDVRKEYLARHVADILEQTKQAAMAEADALKEKNKRAPGMPPGKGKQQAEPKQITTVAQLDTFLNNLQL